LYFRWYRLIMLSDYFYLHVFKSRWLSTSEDLKSLFSFRDLRIFFFLLHHFHNVLLFSTSVFCIWRTISRFDNVRFLYWKMRIDTRWKNFVESKKLKT
jgi:hypothetical protein